MTNESQRFDRIPATPADRESSEDVDSAMATREEVLDFFSENYGIDPAVFEDHTFWERGSGKLWAFRGDAPSPVPIEGLGMTLLRTRQEHWKPTTDAIQRFGTRATKNVLVLDADEAAAFVGGEDQAIERWDGEWGYLIVAHELASAVEPIGVGLYLRGELRSQIPKGRRRDLD